MQRHLGPKIFCDQCKAGPFLTDANLKLHRKVCDVKIYCLYLLVCIIINNYEMRNILSQS